VLDVAARPVLAAVVKLVSTLCRPLIVRQVPGVAVGVLVAPDGIAHFEPAPASPARSTTDLLVQEIGTPLKDALPLHEDELAVPPRIELPRAQQTAPEEGCKRERKLSGFKNGSLAA
jgi:hypothetical protein